MKIGLVAACGLLAALAAPVAAHAQDDDWEFTEDAAQHLSVAAVRYEAGMAIIVQCRDGALTAVMAGLPVASGRLELEAARADGRRDVQTWEAAGAAGAFRSDTAARDVRFMRGSGDYRVHSAAGATPALAATFDLPAQSANLDRVLTACGWAVADDRDLLTRAGAEVSLRDPRPSMSRGSRRNPSRDIAGQGRRVEPPAPRPSGPVPAEQQVSCIVRNMHLAECRADHPPAAGAPVDPRALASLEGHQVFVPAGSDPEGRVLYLATAGRLVTVIDYLGVTAGS